jgi:hypothetical protein
MKNKAPFGCTASRPIPGQLDSLCDHLGLFNMKEIQLTQGKIAIVDDEDFEKVSQFKWYLQKGYHTNYAITYISYQFKYKRAFRLSLYLHRLITNCPKNMFIDHINHDGLDNRKENLKIVTHRENQWNRINKNKSGYIGANLYCGKYSVRIVVNKKKIYLGTYKTALEANNAYMKKANEVIDDNS